MLLIAASEYTRRLRRNKHRALEHQAASLLVLSYAARFSTYEPGRCWRTRAGVRTTVIELVKLLLDIVTHLLNEVQFIGFVNGLAGQTGIGRGAGVFGL